MPASSNGRQPWQAINVAFVASIAVACAGTLVALGGLGGAQASCNTDEAGVSAKPACCSCAVSLALASWHRVRKDHLGLFCPFALPLRCCLPPQPRSTNC